MEFDGDVSDFCDLALILVVIFVISTFGSTLNLIFVIAVIRG